MDVSEVGPRETCLLAARAVAACEHTRAVARVGGAATGADAPSLLEATNRDNARPHAASLSLAHRKGDGRRAGDSCSYIPGKRYLDWDPPTDRRPSGPRNRTPATRSAPRDPTRRGARGPLTHLHPQRARAARLILASSGRRSQPGRGTSGQGTPDQRPSVGDIVAPDDRRRRLAGSNPFGGRGRRFESPQNCCGRANLQSVECRRCSSGSRTARAAMRPGTSCSRWRAADPSDRTFPVGGR